MPAIHNGIGTTFRSQAFGGGAAPINPDFVSTWNTANTSAGSSTSTQVKLPLVSAGSYNFDVDWGDGNKDTITTWNQAETTHTYSSSGTYTITIKGTIEGWQFANAGDKWKILDVSNWGTLTITTSRAFDYCKNLDITATDSPTVTSTSFNSIFRECDALTTPDFSNWDTSTVTDMSEAFNGTALFNGNLDGWVHSGVTTCYRMFISAASFNQDVDDWDVSGITGTGFTEMFRGAITFDSSVAGWDINANPNQMFHSCYSFTGTGLNTWDVSGVTQLVSTFVNCYVLNTDLSSWDVSNVTSFSQCFYACTAFNQNIGAWDMSSATTLNYMFYKANAFNNGGSDTIRNWDVSNVTILTSTFDDAESFNQPLDGWVTSSVVNMEATFANTLSMTYSLSSWDTSSVTTFQSCFQGSNYNADISGWDTSTATNMSRMFQNNKQFNQSIGSWNTSSCLNFLYILYDADAFDQDLSGWTVAQATNLTGILQLATGLSTANYDATLIAWDAQGAMSYSGTVNFGGSKYTAGGAAEAARTSLISKWGGIVDGGAAP